MRARAAASAACLGLLLCAPSAAAEGELLAISANGAVTSITGVVPTAGALRAEVVRGDAVLAAADATGVDVLLSASGAAPGDTVRLLRNGAEVAKLALDGRPAFTDALCGATTSWAARRTDATWAIAKVSLFRFPFGTLDGTVTALDGDSVAGTFAQATSAADHALIAQSKVAGGVTYEIASSRPVGLCAADLVPQLPLPELPAPLRDTTAPAGALTLPRKVLRTSFLRRGTTLKVTPSEPAAITINVFLRQGAKRILVATGAGAAYTAATTRIKVAATRAGKRHLRRPRRAALLVRSTLTDAAGNSAALPVAGLRLR